MPGRSRQVCSFAPGWLYMGSTGFAGTRAEKTIRPREMPFIDPHHRSRPLSFATPCMTKPHCFQLMETPPI